MGQRLIRGFAALLKGELLAWVILLAIVGIVSLITSHV
jgi:hypothetical protein